jgi:hypothetical protein
MMLLVSYILISYTHMYIDKYVCIYNYIPIYGLINIFILYVFIYLYEYIYVYINKINHRDRISSRCM